MVKTYAKGSRAERELLMFLHTKGFAVVRAPSSGGFFSPADIVAIKRGLVLAIECKAWAKEPRIGRKQLEGLRKWCDKAGATGLIGWRTTGKWLFNLLDQAERGNYSWIEMDHLLMALGVS